MFGTGYASFLVGLIFFGFGIGVTIGVPLGVLLWFWGVHL